MSRGKFEIAYREFARVSQIYSRYGADDTEPRSVMTSLIRRTLRGEDVKVPQSIRGWELFEIRGASRAAAALNSSGRKVITAAKRDPQGARRYVG